MNTNLKCAFAVASAVVALGVSKNARADLLTQLLPTSGTYCADGADFTDPGATQHIAIYGGAMYIGTCTENPDGGDPHLAQWGNLPGLGGGAFGGDNFLSMGSAAAEFIAVSPSTGHVWAVNQTDQIWLFNGAGWSLLNGPTGVKPRHIAAFSDTTAYVLGDGSCPGGECIYSTGNGGASWAELSTTANGAIGAVGIAVDPQSGTPWIVQASGHVLQLQGTKYYRGRVSFATWWQDEGTSGLPSNGASGAIGVYQNIPWVIANESAAGGRVFSLASGTWVQESTLANATDIAVDPTSGAVCVVSANGPDYPGQGGNGQTPANDNVWCSSPPLR